LFGSLACVVVAALAAGLTIGLVSIDPFDLALIQATEEADCDGPEEVEELRKEKEYANKLLPLVSQHHLLLVTLLINNACANELLPLLLDRIVPSWLAVLLSVTFVLVFGEILPSAIFTGPQQLRLASALTPVVWTMLTICWVLAYPIACLLDRLLGVEDEGRMRRAELKSLIRLHAEACPLVPSPTAETGGGGGGGNGGASSDSSNYLTLDEVNIMSGALDLKNKTIKDAYVPLDQVHMLHVDEVLDIDKLAELVHQGHSRIPVYDGDDRQNVRGVLLVKRLIVVSPEDKRTVRSIANRWPLICSPDLGLLPLMNLFQDGRSHMALVCDKPSEMLAALRAEQPVPKECKVLGIITIEDVLELLLKEEIADEVSCGEKEIFATRYDQNMFAHTHLCCGVSGC
jgi:metal transporter CNNM